VHLELADMICLSSLMSLNGWHRFLLAVSLFSLGAGIFKSQDVDQAGGYLHLSSELVSYMRT
jgi:hypothetical protein